MSTLKQQRPRSARIVGDGLKLHRRLLRLDGRVHTVISLRPGTTARFSTNYFHDTWHLLSDDHGSRLLATLLWGLSYQARPATVLLIDRPFLTPTPFEADPADPILLVPGWCTRLTPRAVRELMRRLPLRTAPEGTVRWRTHGLATAAYSPRWAPRRGRTDRVKGAIVVTPATPDECRDWALYIAAMDTGAHGTDYTYLDDHHRWVTGEVQTFRRFHHMVGTAGQARRTVLRRADAGTDPSALRPEIWEAADILRGTAHLKIVEWCDGRWQVGRHAAAMLTRAGVHEFEDLRRIGAVEAYRRMLTAGCAPDTRMLWAMDCAISGGTYRHLTTARKQELTTALHRHPIPGIAGVRSDRRVRPPRTGGRTVADRRGPATVLR
ncbi:TfoX/Sxy family DNA transformation protein [Nocardia testacea]|uniref:TfoX/Sxy family DNA transformation protein n=1 Tax=Nocardia testacea TaxID=248551 RepID=UPI003A8832DF